MSQANPSGQPPAPPRLSEDWLATIIGLVIVLVIGLGLIGPGPQNVTITAPPGEDGQRQVLPLKTWQVSATLGGEAASIENAWTALDGGQAYFYTCRDGALRPGSDNPVLSAALPANQSVVVVINECDEEVVITQRTNPAIPWPVFGLFGR
jgi:hypothetical protein